MYLSYKYSINIVTVKSIMILQTWTEYSNYIQRITHQIHFYTLNTKWVYFNLWDFHGEKKDESTSPNELHQNGDKRSFKCWAVLGIK